MGKYLLEGEEMVVAVNQHWFKIAGVLAAPVFGAILVVLIGLVSPADVGFLVEFSIYLWIALLLVCVVRVVLWRREWFVATDRRLLLSYGLVWRQMDMMPMRKVTDMSFNQSVGGRIFGYGTYVLESAGQDQALQRLDYIPDAEHHYRSICTEIFGKNDNRTDDDDDNQLQRPEKPAAGDDGQYGDEVGDYYEGRTRDRPRRDDWDRDDTDPYGVPAQRLPRSHGQRESVERTDGRDDLATDDDPGWSVSREHVPDPQRVRRGRDREGRNRDAENYRP